MNNFVIGKEVSLRTHQLTIRPSSASASQHLSTEEKRHYIFILADILHSLKRRHIIKYFKIKIIDHIFRWTEEVWPYQIDLRLPIDKNPFLLDEFAQEGISRAEAILDEEAKIERKETLARHNLRERKSTCLGAR